MDMTLAAAGKVTTYAGGAGAVFGGLTASDIGVIGGLVVAILGWCTQVYFSRRRDRREQSEYAARMERLARALGDAGHWSEDR